MDRRHIISHMRRFYLSTQRKPAISFIRPAYQPRQDIRCLPPHRTFASKSTVDEQIEDIQEQYATAKDEFEIAQEETEKMSVYAEDDRKAAREELDKLREMFDSAASDPHTGSEIRSRVGQRLRELDNAVKNMEEQALHQD